MIKSLLEFSSEIEIGLECLGITKNPFLHVLVNDGVDCLGDVSQYK